jgi:two-component system sensor histidine kinase KdpD
MITTIQEEAERLNRFIGNLLDMTRLESGAVVPRSSMADLSEIVGSALERAARILDLHPVEVRLPPDLPMLKLDGAVRAGAVQPARQCRQIHGPRRAHPSAGAA